MLNIIQTIFKVKPTKTEKVLACLLYKKKCTIDYKENAWELLSLQESNHFLILLEEHASYTLNCRPQLWLNERNITFL